MSGFVIIIVSVSLAPGGLASAPAVVTGVVTGISQTSATLGATVNPIGLETTARFEYGLTIDYGTSTTEEPVGSGADGVAISTGIVGLACGATYHFRATATNADGSTVGDDATFATLPCTPTTLAATFVANHPVLNGSANPNGTPTSVGFEYGLTNDYGSTWGPLEIGSGTSVVQFSAHLLPMFGGNTVYYRATATNASGTTTGAQATFNQPQAPSVTTGSVTGITETGATLLGTANPNGFPTTARFEYDDGLRSTPNQAIGSGTVAVEIGGGTLSGLSCNKNYSYRALAINEGGTTYGLSSSFRTAPCPAPGVSTGVATGVTDKGATLHATVVPYGLTFGWFQYGLSASYGTLTAGQQLGGLTAVEIATTIQGLTPCTEYHFGAAAYANGTFGYGADATFMTTCARGFMDDPLIPGVTQVRLVHISELRARIDAVRGQVGLTPFVWTHPTLVAALSVVAAADVLDLRTALAQAYVAAALPAPAFTDPLLPPGTPIKAAHIMELRALVTALE